MSGIVAEGPWSAFDAEAVKGASETPVPFLLAPAERDDVHGGTASRIVCGLIIALAEYLADVSPSEHVFRLNAAQCITNRLKRG